MDEKPIDEFRSYGESFSPELLEDYAKRQAMALRFRETNGYFDKLKILRTFYREREAEIIQYGRTDPDRFLFGAYPVDWVTFFTPIEYDAWCSFRYRGMVMYPQYPVLNYFVDFGNPTKKIAIELDGKAYHNKEKDAARDRELRGEGWKVFRITGSEMWKSGYRTFGDIDPDYEMDHQDFSDLIFWLTETGDGVIETIWRCYFRPDAGEMWPDEFPAYSYFQKSLKDHQLIQ